MSPQFCGAFSNLHNFYFHNSSSSNTPHHPRSSVSAAVSDESVAGDSGVYEAAVSSSSRPGNVAQGLFVLFVYISSCTGLGRWSWARLGWLGFRCSAVCLILLRQMWFWQNWLGTAKVNPTQVGDHRVTLYCVSGICLSLLKIWFIRMWTRQMFDSEVVWIATLSWTLQFMITNQADCK